MFDSWAGAKSINLKYKAMYYVKQCECGAVTVATDKNQISMTEKRFLELKECQNWPDMEESKYYCCDHCVNKWGLELCECGSGESIADCCNKGASANIYTLTEGRPPIVSFKIN